MKRLVEYMTAKVDIDVDPRGAIRLLLMRANGRNSKRLAWNDALEALAICREFFPDYAERFCDALGNGRYPETSGIELPVIKDSSSGV